MSILLPEEKNIKITNNYYQVIKQISEEFKIYLSNLKLIIVEYMKRLKQNNEKFNSSYLENKYEHLGYKHVNLKHIISITSIIPSVIEQEMTNLDFFIKAIDEKLESFEKIFKEKSSQYLEQYNSYKEVKNELSKNYREIEHLKVNYITNISMVEEMVHKFYVRKNSMKKKLNTPNEKKKEVTKEPNNISIEEQINSNIQKVKKIEEDYKNNIALVKSIEDKYAKISKESKEKIRKILCELLNGYKELIFTCMLFLTNCYKVPLSEIDTYMRDMVQIDECENFDKIILSSYKNDKTLTNISPQRYTLKFFKKNNTNVNEEQLNNEENNINKSKKSNSTGIAGEGFQELDFLQEEEIFMTIKKMTENFELLNSNNFNVTIEEEKLRCKYLTLKILSFAPISKLYTDKIPPITDEEVAEIEKLMDKKINRVIFIQKLSQFRTRGIFELPEREYTVLIKLFNKIIKTIEDDIDYDSAINIIILSQTYYKIKDGVKEYLQKEIMNNELFRSQKFWEMYANYSITKEVLNCKISDNAEDHDIEESYSNIVFAQLIPMTDNMIDFGLDINVVESIILPFTKKYKFNPELQETVASIINAKKIELQEKNKNKDKIEDNKDINKEDKKE
jgi:hypothetical protein